MVWKIKKISVEKWIKYAIMCGIFIGIVIAIFLINKDMKKSTSKTVTKPVYEYTYSPTLAYSVKLKENKYYDEAVRNEGEKYIRNLVDSVNVTFGGNFQGNTKENITAEYQVKAKLEGYQVASGNKEVIWEKEMPIGDAHTENVNDYSLKYNLSEEIDLDKYEAMVTNIKGELGITLSVNLTFYIEGRVTIQRAENSIEIPIDSSLEIPLNSTLFSINKETGNPVSKQEFIKEQVNIKKNYSFIIICVIFIIVAVISEILIFLMIGIKEEMSEELKKEKRLLRKYRSRMIALSSIPKLDIEEIYLLEEVSDLFRLADEMGRPVVYLHGKDREIDGGKIFVIDGRDKYIYYMSK